MHVHPAPPSSPLLFFFNDTATTEIYTLSLHDALPISASPPVASQRGNTFPSDTPQAKRQVDRPSANPATRWAARFALGLRSEEHTSELQSQSNLVCRLLLEKIRSVRPARLLEIDDMRE